MTLKFVQKEIISKIDINIMKMYNKTFTLPINLLFKNYTYYS